MIAIAARLAAAGPPLAEIWRGYWPARQPFIIYLPTEGALLVSEAEAPGSFHPLRKPDVADSLEGRAFWHGGGLADVQRTFVTDYPIGSSKTAILVNWAEADGDRIIAILLHEQFHVFQRTAFQNPAFSEFVDPSAIPDRLAFAASAETERRILAKAVETDDAGDARRLLQEYFALRRGREAAVAAQANAVERQLERIEGTAKYIDCVGRSMIEGGPERLKTLLAGELRRPLAGQRGGFQMNWFRLRSYGTGAALTYLVSRLDRGDWRARIESGASPVVLLEALVRGSAPRAGPALAEGAKASFGYGAIAQELEPAIRAEEKGEVKAPTRFLPRRPTAWFSTPRRESSEIPAGRGRWFSWGPKRSRCRASRRSTIRLPPCPSPCATFRC
jgi:hypothetical protein